MFRKCVKTHLQQCRIAKFSGGAPPLGTYPSKKVERMGLEALWEGMRGEGREGNEAG